MKGLKVKFTSEWDDKEKFGKVIYGPEKVGHSMERFSVIIQMSDNSIEVEDVERLIIIPDEK